ncbi:MAG: hypothetical protein WBR21_11940, partial [Rouxiella badensis]|uniref:hypothetical protein n=1 Tax=Rouxiella badensis TaxID=1646377 RepID=UPI003C4AFA7C
MRAAYLASLPVLLRAIVKPKQSLPLDVFSYSGEATLPEQILSIRSFVRHAGRPGRFVVVSDGTHTRRSIDLLRKA